MKEPQGAQKAAPTALPSASKDDFDLDFNSLYGSQETADEVETYIQWTPPPMKTNPLDWWKLQKTQFPILAMIARDYLAIPATSAPSERAFSASGDMITADRGRLMPKTVRATQVIRSLLAGPLKNEDFFGVKEKKRKLNKAFSIEKDEE